MSLDSALLQPNISSCEANQRPQVPNLPENLLIHIPNNLIANSIAPTLYVTDETLENRSIEVLSSAQELSFPEELNEVEENFTAYEALLLAQALKKEENKELVIEWATLLREGKQEQVQSAVQQFINKQMGLRQIAQLVFKNMAQNWAKSNKKQKALFVAQKVGNLVFGPLKLIYKTGKTIVKKKDRKKAIQFIKSLFNGDALSSYQVKNALIRGVLEAAISLLIGGLTAIEVLGVGIPTPFLISAGCISAAALAAKAKVDFAADKSPAHFLFETLQSCLSASALGAASVGVGELFTLSNILASGINLDLEVMSDPVTSGLDQLNTAENTGLDETGTITLGAVVNHTLETIQTDETSTSNPIQVSWV